MLNGDEKLLDGLLAEYDAGELGILNGDEELIVALLEGMEVGELEEMLTELDDLLGDTWLDETDNGEYFE